MFNDPQSLTVNGVSKALARVGTADPVRRGKFTTSEGEFTFEVRQDSTANRLRREVRLTQQKIAADPISAVNKQISASVIIAVDEPRYGFSDTELGYLTSSIQAWFNAANRDKLLAGEM